MKRNIICRGRISTRQHDNYYREQTWNVSNGHRFRRPQSFDFINRYKFNILYYILLLHQRNGSKLIAFVQKRLSYRVRRSDAHSIVYLSSFFYGYYFYDNIQHNNAFVYYQSNDFYYYYFIIFICLVNTSITKRKYRIFDVTGNMRNYVKLNVRCHYFVF